MNVHTSRLLLACYCHALKQLKTLWAVYLSAYSVVVAQNVGEFKHLYRDTIKIKDSGRRKLQTITS